MLFPFKKKVQAPHSQTFCVILDYCGGRQTNNLYRKLSRWNTGYTINILDNASPQKKSKYITHQNKTNSGVGGGINDCLELARQAGCNYLFFIVNDIILKSRIDIEYFEKYVVQNSDTVLMSAALTQDSDKKCYPWMNCQSPPANRIACHADLLCCIIDISFIDSFGGFPDSRGGWGFDWELAYHAALQEKKVVICDYMTVKHDNSKTTSHEVLFARQREMQDIYTERYGDYTKIKPPFRGGNE